MIVTVCENLGGLSAPVYAACGSDDVIVKSMRLDSSLARLVGHYTQERGHDKTWRIWVTYE